MTRYKVYVYCHIPVEYFSDSPPDMCGIQRYFDLCYGWSTAHKLIMTYIDTVTSEVTVYA